MQGVREDRHSGPGHRAGRRRSGQQGAQSTRATPPLARRAPLCLPATTSASSATRRFPNTAAISSEPPSSVTICLRRSTDRLISPVSICDTADCDFPISGPAPAASTRVRGERHPADSRCAPPTRVAWLHRSVASTRIATRSTAEITEVAGLGHRINPSSRSSARWLSYRSSATGTNCAYQRFQFGLDGSSGLLSPPTSRIAVRRGSNANSTLSSGTGTGPPCSGGVMRALVPRRTRRCTRRPTLDQGQGLHISPTDVGMTRHTSSYSLSERCARPSPTHDTSQVSAPGRIRTSGPRIRRPTALSAVLNRKFAGRP